ncbi:hypothetical protein [Reyranella sp.]|uniref:hypothetical protein n=1 Tax=Reyranella sp. TaxID=1929291 RepID=UPI003BAAB496
MSTPTYIKKLREYSRGPTTIPDLFALETALTYGTSDRAMAVLMGAMVEDTLGRWLLFNMRDDLNKVDQSDLTGPEGALATFSSKTLLAYAIKIIGPVTRHDLTLIRHLRNEFAHSRRPIDFRVPEVAQFCAQFQFPELPEVTTPKSYIDTAPDAVAAADSKHPRTRYFVTCHTIAYRMSKLSSQWPQFHSIVLPEQPLP